MSRIVRYASAVVLSMICCGAGAAVSAMTPYAQLEGAWRSEAGEPLPGQDGAVRYLVREFEFSGQSWRIHFTMYGDEALRTPIFSGDNSGEYILEAGQIRTGRPVQFRFRERSLTALSPDAASALTRAGCGDHAWVVGETQSVLARGCVAFRVFPLHECHREYDRVALVAKRLFLGARPDDGFMCAANRRPETVSHSALRLVK